MRSEKSSLIQFVFSAFFLMAWMGSPVNADDAKKLAQDSMKRFSVKIPATWKAIESVDETVVTVSGDEAVINVYLVFRGDDFEGLHRRMAMPIAMRSLDGPPKKNKIKWEKTRIDNLKAIDSVFDVKGGGEDAHPKYRVHVITIEGDRHKFSIVATIPLDLAQKNGLEAKVMEVIESFKENN